MTREELKQIYYINKEIKMWQKERKENIKCGHGTKKEMVVKYWLEKAVKFRNITQKEADEIYTKKYPKFYLN